MQFEYDEYLSGVCEIPVSFDHGPHSFEAALS